MKPGYVVTYPNREKRLSSATRVSVALVLVLSAALMLVVTLGGWSKLAGLPALNVIWCAAYLAMAVYVMRWARGLLPIAAGLGALMLAFTVIAQTAAAGVAWGDRDGPSYAPVHSLFGGAGLSPDTLSALTVAIAVSQAILVLISLGAFRQGWNIEYEVPAAGATAAGR